MKNIILLLTAFCLIFSSGCDHDGGNSHGNTISSPTQPGSPAPLPSPAPAPVPVAAPVTVIAISGFATPTCSPDLAKTLYVLISLNADGKYHAFADVDNQAYDLKNWEYKATSLADGSIVTATEANPSCIQSPADFVPLCLNGDLIGKCSQKTFTLTTEFVAKTNNTVVTGQLSSSDDGTLSVLARQGLCTDNGYIPAWLSPCP